MKLRTKIAGTLALPLALAVAASTQAATVVDTAQHRLNLGGFVAAQSVWINDDSADTLDNKFNLGTSRFNVGYTNKEHGITFFYEQGIDSNNPGRRHAYIAHDGWVAGWTLSFFGNAVGGGDTIDHSGLTTYSARQDRNALIGKRFNLGDGLTLGVAVEQVFGGTGSGHLGLDEPRDTAAPDLTVNFTGKFGSTTVFAAAQQYNYGDAATAAAWTEDDSNTRFTLGLNQPLGDFGLRAAATVVTDAYTAVSVAGQYKVSDAVRTNLIVEQYLDEVDDADFTSVWVNAFYTLPSGWEWGGEVQFVSGDTFAPGAGTNALNDGDFAVRIQAKYAF